MSANAEIVPRDPMPASNPYDSGLDRTAANFVPRTPLSFLERTASVYPDRAAVIHGDVRRNRPETGARGHRLAGALARRGIGLGDTVAVMAPNVPATSVSGTRKAVSNSRTTRRTSPSRAARTSPRSRSRACCTAIRRCWKPRGWPGVSANGERTNVYRGRRARPSIVRQSRLGTRNRFCFNGLLGLS